eukprot:13126-Alexandrium_andersonii.AAC.1
MSASLVGSEMCIRDSAPGGRRPTARQHRTATAVWQPAAAGSPLGGAVSYTHLTLPTICSV